MLIACPDCRRQFDVAGIETGERIRCLCGKLVEVPEPRVHEARTLHCSSCGGKLAEDASECAYCGGAITSDERNLGPACPECFARLQRGARYCRECGVEIRPERLQVTPTSSSCPRCQGKLVLCKLEDGAFTECTGCGGLWLSEEEFDRIVDQRDESAVGKAATGRPAPEEDGPAPPPDTVRYIPCPICGQLMNRKNFASCSGVIIDWCKGHGVWFDTHELERILDFVAGGGLDKARRLELDRQRREIDRAEAHRRFVQQSMRSGGGQITSPPLTGQTSSSDSFLFDLAGALGSSLRGLLRF